MKKLQLRRIKTIPEPPDYQVVQPVNIDFDQYMSNWSGNHFEISGSRIRVRVAPGQFSDWVDLGGAAGAPGLPGEIGPVGRMGLSGKEGKQGADGVRGVKGPVGPKGNTGKPGIPGQVGSAGNSGPTGKPGAQGLPGANGRDGDQGQQGPKGDTPAHRWIGTRLQFQTNTGKWGKLVDLQGPAGLAGGGGSLTQIITSGAGDGVKYRKELDQADSITLYLGESDPGTTTGQALWRISKIVTAVSGDVSVTWADGTADFVKIWTDRLSYTYA